MIWMKVKDIMDSETTLEKTHEQSIYTRKRQPGRDGEVDGGEDHHAGDVHGDHQLVAGRVLHVCDVGRCLGSIIRIIETFENEKRV